MMSGRTYVAGHDGKITLEKQWSEIDQPFPLETLVRDITVHDPGYKQYKTVQEFFETGSKVFMLGNFLYGTMGEVIEVNPEHKGRIRVSMVATVEPNLTATRNHWLNFSERFMTANECSSRLSVSPHLFARLTGSVFLAKALELNPFMERDTATNKLN
ncbi:UNVERIFIED_CONTAM: hypothetical protein GTU68_021680, partial [Idotea baltica]|nr:hypothetical protein [Idotea baltica]